LSYEGCALAFEEFLFNGILDPTYYQQDCPCEVSWLFGECLVCPAYQNVVMRAMFKESADIEEKVEAADLTSRDSNIVSSNEKCPLCDQR
jgi:hypothetical protein